MEKICQTSVSGRQKFLQIFFPLVLPHLSPVPILQTNQDPDFFIILRWGHAIHQTCFEGLTEAV